MLKMSDIPQDIRDLLAFPFDFSVDEVAADPFWFKAEPNLELIPIAGEGTGGTYFRLAESGRILFVDSEGAAGIIAENFEDLIQLIVSHPYWMDLLKFSGKGSLPEMHRAVDWASRNYLDCYPEASQALLRIQQSLGIRPSSLALERLHGAVSNSTNVLRLYAPDGSELGSLFNGFTAPI